MCHSPDKFLRLRKRIVTRPGGLMKASRRRRHGLGFRRRPPDPVSNRRLPLPLRRDRQDRRRPVPISRQLRRPRLPITAPPRGPVGGEGIEPSSSPSSSAHPPSLFEHSLAAHGSRRAASPRSSP